MPSDEEDEDWEDEENLINKKDDNKNRIDEIKTEKNKPNSNDTNLY